MGDIAKLLFGEEALAAVEARLTREVAEHDELYMKAREAVDALETKTRSVNRLLAEAAVYGMRFMRAGLPTEVKSLNPHHTSETFDNASEMLNLSSRT